MDDDDITSKGEKTMTCVDRRKAMWAGIAAVVAACAICGGTTAAGVPDAASACNVFGDFAAACGSGNT